MSESKKKNPEPESIRLLDIKKYQKSLFEQKLKPRFGYKVPIQISLPDGTTTTITKLVKAWNKGRAKKAALAQCLTDIRVATGPVTRVKNRNIK